MNLSFSGCGFIGVYHLGVLQCLRERSTHLLRNTDRVFGASAGSLVGALLVANVDVSRALPRFYTIISRIRTLRLGPFNLGFDMMKELDDGLEDLLPLNAHKLATGRLHVSLTILNDRNKFENVIISHFTSKRDLIQALKCSCFIPVFGGFRPPRFRGKLCMDGGFTDNLPWSDEGETITVSPFSGESDICPDDSKLSASMYTVHAKNLSVQLSFNNLKRLACAIFPMAKNDLDELKQSGYKDCLKYLQRKDISTKLNKLAVSSLCKKNNEISGPKVHGREVCASSVAMFETTMEVWLPDPGTLVKYYPSTEMLLKQIPIPGFLLTVGSMAVKSLMVAKNGTEIIVKGAFQAMQYVGKFAWASLRQILCMLEELLFSSSEPIGFLNGKLSGKYGTNFKADCDFKLVVWAS